MTRNRYITQILTGLIACKILLFLALAWNSQFSIDELRHGGMFYYFDQFYKNFDPMKSVLYTIPFGLAHLLGESAFDKMILARMISAFFAILTLAFVYLIARKIGRDKTEALLIVAVTLGFTTFMERAFRVRAEPLALLFAVSALYRLINNLRNTRKILIVGLLCGAAFLTTQKSIYFDLAIGMAILGNGLFAGRLKESIKDSIVLLAGFFISFFVYCFYFGGADFVHVATAVIMRPIPLALHGGGRFDIFYLFILQTLSRNIFWYLLCLAGLLVTAGRISRIGEKERVVLIFTTLITVFMFNHSQPWPYIFTWCIPFLALFATTPIGVAEKLHQKAGSIFVAVTLLFLLLGFGRNISYFSHANVAQKMVMNQAESLLHGDDLYLDGIGMLAGQRQAGRAWWIKKHIRAIKLEGENSAILSRIFGENPKLIILNFHSHLLKKELAGYTDDSYTPVFSNILLSGTRIEKGFTKTFVNRYEGSYSLYDQNGRELTEKFTIDGAETGKADIKTGSHKLRYDGKKPVVWLLPSGLHSITELPPAQKPFALFQHMLTR